MANTTPGNLYTPTNNTPSVRQHNNSFHTNPGERTFGTTLWEKKLEKKVEKKRLLKEIQDELLQETLSDLRKIAETLEDDKWKYEKFTFDSLSV